MVTAFLLLGTNIGDRAGHLLDARELLASPGLLSDLFPDLPRGHSVTVTRVSRIYETAAWGKIEQDDYLNQVVSIATLLNPQQLLLLISTIESRMGRIRKKIWEPRIIDLDILFYGMEVISEEKLVIPHPHLQDRRFALTPLAEIAPDLLHPVLQKSIRALLEMCPDTLWVKEFTQKV